jgi:hypothetical protein
MRFQGIFDRAAAGGGGGGGSSNGGGGGGGGNGGNGGDGGIASLSASELWPMGLALIKREPKRAADWSRARAIFERLATLQPAVMWSSALAGVCCAYAPGASRDDGARAAEYARAAARADGASPLPHALLCRATLVADGAAPPASLLAAAAAAIFGGAPPSPQAAAAVRAAFAALVARPGADARAYAPTHEHAWLVLDAVRCVSKCAAGGELAPLIAAYCAAFPGLAAAARAL